MAVIIDYLNRVSATWASLMGAILWQSTLLVLVVTVVTLLLRRASPGVRYWLWQIVTIKLLLMPFWVLAVPLPFAAAPASPADSAALPLPSVGAAVPAVANASPGGAAGPVAVVPAKPAAVASVFAMLSCWAWLMLAWVGVMVWKIVAIARQRVGLGRLMRTTIAAQGDLVERVRGLCRRLGLRREPSVLLVDQPGLLFVCGLWGPSLVVPQTLPGTLRSEEMEQVLLHELAHLRRGDLYWGWTIELARLVYFFHPAVYWMSYCLHLERELACDQVAMAVSGHTAGDYAQTLVRVASHAVEPAAGAVSLGGRAGKPKEQ